MFYQICSSHVMLILLFLSRDIQEKERLISGLEDHKATLSSEMADKGRLSELLEKVQADKKRLSGRVNKLVSNGNLNIMYKCIYNVICKSLCYKRFEHFVMILYTNFSK